MQKAREEEYVVTLGDSQILTYIDELKGIDDADQQAAAIKRQIRTMRRQENTIANRKKLKSLYAELDNVQFVPEYLCLIVDSVKDYYRACEGFLVNGIKFVRLLGTNGGVKMSTIVFVSEQFAPELQRRIENGRNLSKKLVPAKYEAYRALTCSSSSPVSFPVDDDPCKGIIVVDGCFTHFNSEVVYLNDEADGEPYMEYRPEESIELEESDGYGIMLPYLAERWSKELKLGYTTCGVNTRFAFEKGMVFTFDFLDFAESVAHDYIIKDAWGVDRDVRKAALILTTSMVKLWDSYDSCEDYISNSLSNRYTIRITKTCPKELEHERSLNYQFIQSYNLTDEQIDELIQPTVDEINDILSGDWVQAVLFAKGKHLSEDVIGSQENDFAKAMMVRSELFNDPFVKGNLYRMIKRRIDRAKIGVLKVRGNYSIVCGDPYSLCQSVFGLEVTGLLKAGDIYNKYWSDLGVPEVACFRAPMTCHNNIRLLSVARSAEIDRWYQYLDTCTLFNSWDTCAQALNGFDKDGDLVFLTNNKVLTENLVELPAIMCVQRRAEKKEITEEDLIQANINSFGDEIGKITNRITAMFDVMTKFEPESVERKELDYRIKCGQLYQQNAIDKAKGIVAKPMPAYWYNTHAINEMDDSADKEFLYSIVANKKPYFMRYIYPDLMKEYNSFVKQLDTKSLITTGRSLAELLEAEELNEKERLFVNHYYKYSPVSMHDCVVNRICRKFEQMFAGALRKLNAKCEFDYTIMQSGTEYRNDQYYKIVKLYDKYRDVSKQHLLAQYNDDVPTSVRRKILARAYREECEKICPNSKELTDMVLDMCYRKNTSKQFAWDVCGSDIIDNLLLTTGYTIKVPVLDIDGDIQYAGDTFSLRTVCLNNELVM